MTSVMCTYALMCDRPAVALVDMSPVNPELPICRRCLDTYAALRRQQCLCSTSHELCDECWNS